MSPKELFATVINSASDARTDRILADVAAAVPVHYEPLGQDPGAVRTACGIHAAPCTTNREASVTCLDCLDAMDRATGKHEAPKRPVRVVVFSAAGAHFKAKVELVGGGFEVVELTAIEIRSENTRPPILVDVPVSSIPAIFNGIAAALRDIGELLPLQAAMEPEEEEPEPFDEATGPDDLRERVREYEAGIEGCRE